MGGLALASAAVCMTLPETHNEPTMEDLYTEEERIENEKFIPVANADDNFNFESSL